MVQKIPEWMKRRSIRMIRSKLWFRCAAMHDPVTPVIVRPALVGWDAKRRKVDLTIERPFKGDELVMRMKGWVTADVKQVVEIVRKHGFLKIMDDRNLVVETETERDHENLVEDLRTVFNDEVNLDRI
jgi:hypothetical protein